MVLISLLIMGIKMIMTIMMLAVMMMTNVDSYDDDDDHKWKLLLITMTIGIFYLPCVSYRGNVKSQMLQDNTLLLISATGARPSLESLLLSLMAANQHIPGKSKIRISHIICTLSLCLVFKFIFLNFLASRSCFLPD